MSVADNRIRITSWLRFYCGWRLKGGGLFRLFERLSVACLLLFSLGVLTHPRQTSFVLLSGRLSLLRLRRTELRFAGINLSLHQRTAKLKLFNLQSCGVILIRAISSRICPSACACAIFC